MINLQNQLIEPGQINNMLNEQMNKIDNEEEMEVLLREICPSPVASLLNEDDLYTAAPMVPDEETAMDEKIMEIEDRGFMDNAMFTMAAFMPGNFSPMLNEDELLANQDACEEFERHASKAISTITKDLNDSQTAALAQCLLKTIEAVRDTK